MVIGNPLLPGVDAVQLPAADDRVLHAGRVAGELLAAAERQVVDEAAHETVIDVEVRQAVVALRIVVVEEPLPAVEAGRADAGRGRLGVGALRPRIRERQQRAAAAVLEFGVEGVVVRPAAPVAVDVDDEVGIRLALGDRRRDRGCTAAPARCCAASADWCPWCRCSSARASCWRTARAARRATTAACTDCAARATGSPRGTCSRRASPRPVPRSSETAQSDGLERRSLPERLDVVAAAHIRIDVRGAVDLAALRRIEEHAVAAAQHRLRPPKGRQAKPSRGAKTLNRSGFSGLRRAGVLVVRAVHDAAVDERLDRRRAGRRARSRGCARPSGSAFRRARCDSPSAAPGSR